jgi:hypothetical protein
MHQEGVFEMTCSLGWFVIMAIGIQKASQE